MGWQTWVLSSSAEHFSLQPQPVWQAMSHVPPDAPP
jgi:hypothetical protein